MSIAESGSYGDMQQQPLTWLLGAGLDNRAVPVPQQPSRSWRASCTISPCSPSPELSVVLDICCSPGRALHFVRGLLQWLHMVSLRLEAESLTW